MENMKNNNFNQAEYEELFAEEGQQERELKVSDCVRYEVFDSRSNGVLDCVENPGNATLNATRKNKGMTGQMKKACELLIMKDINGLSNDQICAELGINRSTLYRWKQRKDFNDYLNGLSEEFQRSFLSEAYSELRKIMMYGKPHERLKAIELMLKNQGRLKEVREQTSTTEIEVNVQDIFKELGI